MQAKLSWLAETGLPTLNKFTIEEEGEQLQVQPLWVVVHQEEPGSIAR